MIFLIPTFFTVDHSESFLIIQKCNLWRDCQFCFYADCERLRSSSYQWKIVMKLCAKLGSQLCSNLHLGYYLVVPKKLDPVGWTVCYEMMKWYWLIIDGTWACMHLYIEKVETQSGVTDTFQTQRHWKIELWIDCYLVTIWRDSCYVCVVWF